MNNAPLRGIEACVFDAYGTLFDFATATRRCKEELGVHADRLTTLWREWDRTPIRSYADRRPDRIVSHTGPTLRRGAHIPRARPPAVRSSAALKLDGSWCACTIRTFIARMTQINSLGARMSVVLPAAYCRYWRIASRRNAICFSKRVQAAHTER